MSCERHLFYITDCGAYCERCAASPTDEQWKKILEREEGEDKAEAERKAAKAESNV